MDHVVGEAGGEAVGGVALQAAGVHHPAEGPPLHRRTIGWCWDECWSSSRRAAGGALAEHDAGVGVGDGEEEVGVSGRRPGIAYFINGIYLEASGEVIEPTQRTGMHP